MAILIFRTSGQWKWYEDARQNKQSLLLLKFQFFNGLGERVRTLCGAIPAETIIVIDTNYASVELFTYGSENQAGWVIRWTGMDNLHNRWNIYVEMKFLDILIMNA